MVEPQAREVSRRFDGDGSAVDLVDDLNHNEELLGGNAPVPTGVLPSRGHNNSGNGGGRSWAEMRDELHASTQRDPQKFTKYDLSDVDDSEATNAAAAFDFLNEMARRRQEREQQQQELQGEAQR